MKANELRIGNLLQGEPIQDVNRGIYSDGVFAITGYGISEMERGRLSKADPIPLTEEWILKLGFVKKNKALWRGLYGNNKIRFWYAHEYKKFRFYGMDYNFIWQDIEYVHQLQNLYFAITGEELTIKEIL